MPWAPRTSQKKSAMKLIFTGRPRVSSLHGSEFAELKRIIKQHPPLGYRFILLTPIGGDINCKCLGARALTVKPSDIETTGPWALAR